MQCLAHRGEEHDALSPLILTILRYMPLSFVLALAACGMLARVALWQLWVCKRQCFSLTPGHHGDAGFANAVSESPFPFTSCVRSQLCLKNAHVIVYVSAAAGIPGHDASAAPAASARAA